MKKIRPEKKYEKIIWAFVLLLCVAFLIYDVILFMKWFGDRNKILEEKDQISEVSNFNEVEDENAELINPPDDKNDDYWNFIKLPFIDVDLRKLQGINDETVGFLNVAGTNINYPVVQTYNNDFYIENSFRKEPNDAGWIFMDFRNNSKSFGRNTIIYGHGRLDKTMFGTLKNILNSSWIKNRDNHVVRYASETELMLFQVISVYTIPVETYYIKTGFTSDGEYNKWLNTMIDRSEYDFNTNVNEKDRILTLSTCYQGDKQRVVMHAKLIKRSKK